MKRIIIAILLPLTMMTLAASCEKESPAEHTTYTVTMAMPTVTSSASVHCDLTAYEYNDAGEKVANNFLYKAVYGSSKTFTANPRAVKVKLHVKMYSDNSSEYLWVQQVFYLEQGRNIEIKLEDDSRVGRKEP